MHGDIRIIGRWSEEARTDERASTSPVATSTVEFVSGAEGASSVELLRSNDDEDRGGVVLRLTVNTEDGWVPHAVQRGDGVDVHVCGDAEAETLLTAIEEVLRVYRERYARPVVPRETKAHLRSDE